MTARRRKSPEQIVRLLGKADRLLANGSDVAAVCRELEISESSYYRWRERYGSMNVDDAKRLKELEKENATLKRLLADVRGHEKVPTVGHVEVSAGGHLKVPALHG